MRSGVTDGTKFFYDLYKISADEQGEEEKKNLLTESIVGQWGKLGVTIMKFFLSTVKRNKNLKFHFDIS